MTDIFISYSRHDQEWVAKLAMVLEDSGYSVWRDTQLLAGQDFHHTIPAVLEKVCCAIVVWSKVSAGRDWVLVEANYARERKILIPLKIDDVQPPLLFSLLHTEDMSQWDGSPTHPSFQRLLQAVQQYCTLPLNFPLTDESALYLKGQKKLVLGKTQKVLWAGFFFVLLGFIGVNYLPGVDYFHASSSQASLHGKELSFEGKIQQAKMWLESEDGLMEKRAVGQLQSLAKIDSVSGDAKRLLAVVNYFGLGGYPSNHDKGCLLYEEALALGNEEAENPYAKLCKN